MDKMRDHATITAEPRAHSNTPPIRPEILEVFRQGGWRDDSDRKRQNYQDAFDRLIHLFGRSPKMAIVSWRIAHNLALLIGDRDPRGWRWGGVRYDDPFLKKAVREFEDFEGLFFRSLASSCLSQRRCRTASRSTTKGLPTSSKLSSRSPTREHEP